LTAESAETRIGIDSISASSVSEETRCLTTEDEHLPIQLTDAQVNEYTSIVARRMPNAWAFNGTTRVTIDEADAPGVFPPGYGYVGCMLKVNRDEGANPPKLFITRHGTATPDRPTRFTLQASTPIPQTVRSTCTASTGKNTDGTGYVAYSCGGRSKPPQYISGVAAEIIYGIKLDGWTRTQLATFDEDGRSDPKSHMIDGESPQAAYKMTAYHVDYEPVPQNRSAAALICKASEGGDCTEANAVASCSFAWDSGGAHECRTTLPDNHAYIIRLHRMEPPRKAVFAVWRNDTTG